MVFQQNDCANGVTTRHAVKQSCNLVGQSITKFPLEIRQYRPTSSHGFSLSIYDISILFLSDIATSREILGEKFSISSKRSSPPADSPNQFHIACRGFKGRRCRIALCAFLCSARKVTRKTAPSTFALTAAKCLVAHSALAGVASSSSSSYFISTTRTSVFVAFVLQILAVHPNDSASPFSF